MIKPCIDGIRMMNGNSYGMADLLQPLLRKSVATDRLEPTVPSSISNELGQCYCLRLRESRSASKFIEDSC